jgi:hypothetical protein
MNEPLGMPKRQQVFPPSTSMREHVHLFLRIAAIRLV